MNPLISLHTWNSLPTEVRSKVRSIFNIPRSSSTVVSDGRLETDGTTNEDLRFLTIEKMQTYLEDDSTDFHKLFDKVVDRISGRVETIKTGPIERTPVSVDIPLERVRRTRKNKNEKETEQK